MDLLICNECEQQFDSILKIPRILVKCGHSICDQCVKDHLKKGKPINCVEDNFTLDTKELTIDHFPINQGLCKILKSNQNSVKNLSFESESKQIPSENKHNDASDDLSSMNSIMTEKNKVGNSKLDQDDQETETNIAKKNYCKIHKKLFELYCKNCKKLICYGCALSPQHKPHDYVTKEEIERDEKKYKKEVDQLIEKIEQKTKQVQPQFVEKFSESKFKIKKMSCNNAVNEFIDILQDKKTNWLQKIDKYFQDEQSKFIMQHKTKLQSHIHNFEDWQKQAKNMVEILKNSEEIFFSEKLPIFLENYQNLNKGKKELTQFQAEYKKLTSDLEACMNNSKIQIEHDGGYKFKLGDIEELDDVNRKTQKKLTFGLKRKKTLPQEEYDTNPNDEEYTSGIKSDVKNKMKGFDSFGHKEPKVQLPSENEASNVEKKSEQEIKQELQKKAYNTYSLKPTKLNSHLRNRNKELKVTNVKFSDYKSNISVKKSNQANKTMRLIDQAQSHREKKSNNKRNQSVLYSNIERHSTHGRFENLNRFKNLRRSTPDKVSDKNDKKVPDTQSLKMKKLTSSLNNKMWQTKSKKNNFVTIKQELMKKLVDENTKEIKISNVDITSDQFEEILQLIKDSNPLTVLNFSHLKLRDQDIETFVSEMDKFPVMCIDFSYNYLTKQSLNLLFKFIQQNNKVQQLNLTGNMIKTQNLPSKIDKFKQKGTILIIE